MNPFHARLVALFPASRDGLINFTQFAQGLHPLHSNASKKEKLELLFKVYDLNGDGLVDRDDIIQALKTATGNNLGSDRLQQIAVEYLKGRTSLNIDDFITLFPDDEEVRKKLSITKFLGGSSLYRQQEKEGSDESK
eukprot:TRINITY_DN5547_c0_g1_i1.p1 TRINITY_DN5547_c0_g1~~TRINITY_DN5547_c0_g1_i1.p1  ORF type:complete len:137 (-),score=38.75 TRINITY_DN5547_c0_g1_i1:141-551(-)